ncbi:hypothetical protein CDD82_4059 [Ophiocordyceps australis]|uniref:Translation machinery-associated protein 16 n=1 Tax=Ophiocordyceps australis TaxID=1399860 RepID=A0A2C5Z5K8_9HYPO|nr:hypothetical protein CDD82_4059 [Ophiocordyceps australis]
MPSSLLKTRKQIAKKRNGDVSALHEKSRDSLRLHKASVRDRRLEKLATARDKKEEPIFSRAAYFQTKLNMTPGAPNLAVVQSFIHDFIHQYDQEQTLLRKNRRPGRPPTTREDLVKMKIAALEAEYKNGFVLPDMLHQDGVEKLRGWEGSWSKLTALSWIRISSKGLVRQAEFPSKGTL